MFTTKKSDETIDEILTMLDFANDELIINQYIKSAKEQKTIEALNYLKDLLSRARKNYRD
jgi:hypothetical protein